MLINNASLSQKVELIARNIAQFRYIKEDGTTITISHFDCELDGPEIESDEIKIITEKPDTLSGEFISKDSLWRAMWDICSDTQQWICC